MVKVAIIDYQGPKSVHAGKLYAKLLIEEGYEITFAKELSELSDPEKFDVILIHPGAKKQKECIEFAKTHPKIKTAIVSPVPDDYPDEEIPVLSYKSYRIIPFIEGIPYKTFK